MSLREQFIVKHKFPKIIQEKTLAMIPEWLDLDIFCSILDLIDLALEDTARCDDCERVDPDECYSIVCDNPPERW